MDLIVPQIQGVYNLYDSIKNCNNVPCPHIVQRVKATEKLMLFIALKNPDQLSDDVNKALERLGEVLSSAAELITKFSEAYRVTKFMRPPGEGPGRAGDEAGHPREHASRTEEQAGRAGEEAKYCKEKVERTTVFCRKEVLSFGTLSKPH